MNSKTVPILSVPVSARDHSRGLSTAFITLVQYGDYQCPNCGSFYPALQNVLHQLGDQIRFVFRHFPCSDVHPDAHLAAEAAEAAASQGKFWEMHDCLFTNQHALSNGYLVDHAVSVGLNIRRFLREVTGDIHVSRVLEDIASGKESGVNHTPTLFINRISYRGDLSEESLHQTLAEYLAIG